MKKSVEVGELHSTTVVKHLTPGPCVRAADDSGDSALINM